MTDKKEMDYMRARVFFEKKIPIHISLKNGSFYNGYISELPTHEFFFIYDRETGKQLIFYIELVKPIVEFNNKKTEEEDAK